MWEYYKQVQYIADEKYIDYTIERRITRPSARKHLNRLIKLEKATGLHGTELIKDLESTRKLIIKHFGEKEVTAFLNSIKVYKDYKEDSNK